jgi:hypothetical protein
MVQSSCIIAYIHRDLIIQTRISGRGGGCSYAGMKHLTRAEPSSTIYQLMSYLSWTKAKKYLQEIQKPESGGCKK